MGIFKIQKAVLLGLFFIYCLYAGLAHGQSTPAFWKVASNTGTLYLMGSMHFGSDDFYPLPQEVQAAFASSDILVVEVDISRLDPQKLKASLFKHGGMPSGKRLSDYLSKEDQKKLAKIAAKHQWPGSIFEPFQPWFAGMQLVERALTQQNLRADLGVDFHFLKNTSHQRVEALETLEQQLKIFSDSPIEEQVKFLRQTVDDLENSEEYFSVMEQAWVSGDIDALYSKLILPYVNKEETKKIFKRLFGDRNDSMSDAADRYLKGNQTVFFMVGLGHMLGPDGIVAQLKQRGYRVDRVKYKTATKNNSEA